MTTRKENILLGGEDMATGAVIVMVETAMAVAAGMATETVVIAKVVTAKVTGIEAVIVMVATAMAEEVVIVTAVIVTAIEIEVVIAMVETAMVEEVVIVTVVIERGEALRTERKRLVLTMGNVIDSFPYLH